MAPSLKLSEHALSLVPPLFGLLLLGRPPPPVHRPLDRCVVIFVYGRNQ